LNSTGLVAWRSLHGVPSMGRRCQSYGTRSDVLFGVSGHLGVVLTARRPQAAASREVVLSPRVFGANRTGYSVPRSLHDVPFGRPRGIPARASPRLPRKAVRPLTDFEPSSETPSGAARIRPDGEPSFRTSGSSHEVLRPYSELESADRPLHRNESPVPTGRHPSSVFLRPSRASSLLTPAALFHAAAAHGVHPFRAFPCA